MKSTTAPTNAPQVIRSHQAGRADAHVDPRRRPPTGPGFRALLAGLAETRTRHGVDLAPRHAHEDAHGGKSARHAAGHDLERDDRDRDLERDTRRDDDREEMQLSALEPFSPPPPVLAPPVLSPAAAPQSGSALAHAEAAALAERLVTSMRVGKVGRDGHEVRMHLAVSSRADVEVRLRLVDGALSAHLVASPGALSEAESIADALRSELDARGLSLDDVRVELG